MSVHTPNTSTMWGDKPLPSLEYVARLKIAAECCELAQRLVSIYSCIFFIHSVSYTLYSHTFLLLLILTYSMPDRRLSCIPYTPFPPCIPYTNRLYSYIPYEDHCVSVINQALCLVVSAGIRLDLDNAAWTLLNSPTPASYTDVTPRKAYPDLGTDPSDPTRTHASGANDDGTQPTSHQHPTPQPPTPTINPTIATIAALNGTTHATLSRASLVSQAAISHNLSLVEQNMTYVATLLSTLLTTTTSDSTSNNASGGTTNNGGGLDPGNMRQYQALKVQAFLYHFTAVCKHGNPYLGTLRSLKYTYMHTPYCSTYMCYVRLTIVIHSFTYIIY